MAKKKKNSRSGYSASNAQEITNAAKTLYANICFTSVDKPIRSIVVTSTVPSEGKTTTSINLARAVATSGKTVLLVEADLRRRTLGHDLGIRPKSGIYGVLSGTCALSAALSRTDTANVYFLDAEAGIPNPADIFSSKRFAALAEKLVERIDFVIFDTPPVGTFVDAAILSTIADGVVFVVRPGTAKRSAIVNAYEQLTKAGANILGVCGTFTESLNSGYYYAYYTKEGNRATPPSAKLNNQAVEEGEIYHAKLIFRKNPNQTN